MRAAWPWLVLAACLAHGAGLANGFVYDDHRFIDGNPALPGLDLARAFFDPGSHTADGDRDVYRPLRALGHAWDWRRWNGDPFGFHLHSLLAHVLAVLGAQALIRRLLGRGPALAGSLLLAVHPAGVEVVGWVSSRGDQYALLGSLLALHWALPDRDAPATVLRSCGAALAATLACLGKESAAVLPLVVWLAERAILRRRRWSGVLAVAAGVGLSCVVRQVALDGASPVQTPPHGGSLLSQAGWSLFGFTTLLGHLAWPPWLSVDAPQDLWALGPPVGLRTRTWAGLLLLGLPLLLWRTRPRLAFALAWAWLAWLPSGSLLITLRSLVTDRSAYPMLAPLGAALALGLPRLDAQWRRAGLGAGVLLVCALAWSAHLRTTDFRSDASLWSATLTGHPGSVRGHLGLAAAAPGEGPRGALLERAAALAAPGSKEHAVALLALGRHRLEHRTDPRGAATGLAAALGGLETWARREGRASADLLDCALLLGVALEGLVEPVAAEAALRSAAGSSTRPDALLLAAALLLRRQAQLRGDADLASRSEIAWEESRTLAPDGAARARLEQIWAGQGP